MAVNAPHPWPGLAATPVIVTDGETRTALACVRALGRRGVPVHVLATRRGALAAASRHCRRVHAVPDPEREPAAWGAAVRAAAAVLPGAVLLPVTEVAMGNAFEAELDRHLLVCAPPRDAYEAAVDKHALLERAVACGLDAPRSPRAYKTGCGHAGWGSAPLPSHSGNPTRNYAEEPCARR